MQTTIIPHSQKPLVSRTYPSQSELILAIQNAAEAQKIWHKVPLQDRIDISRKFINQFKHLSTDISLELSLQIGRPISQCSGEINTMLHRAEYMISIASEALADVSLRDTDNPGFKRYIKRTPLGVVLAIVPWNFPYLVTVNSVLPAIIAGNAVLLKPSPQTPLAAERFALALTHAGVPNNVIQVIHMSPSLTSFAVQHPLVDFVSFTGSVSGGHSIVKSAADGPGFTGVGLELGGKDPAYVRGDAILSYTIAELVEGAFFNSGQSCCAVERIYVHESLYDEFVQKFVDVVKSYKLGDPTKSETNLGPVVSVASAVRIRKQVADAISAGAKPLIPEDLFSIAIPGTAYVAPQVLINVNHSMDVMKDETFGPVVGIQGVSSDEEAIKLMNDSPYGLTASIWTNAEGNPESEKAFLRIVDQLETGTVFLNRLITNLFASPRCDYLDPALAWTGVKDSGRGVSLGKFGYDQLTRAKSVYMKIKTSTT